MHDDLLSALGLLLFLIVVLVGPLFLFIRFSLMLRRKDADRVRSYIEQHGGRLLSLKWAPFSNAWFIETSGRFYKVRYFDRDGNEHTAICKSSLLTGVFFTEDRIVSYGRAPVVEDSRVKELERENQRLREELRRSKADEV